MDSKEPGVFKSHGLPSVFRIWKPPNTGGEGHCKNSNYSGSDACWGQVQCAGSSRDVTHYGSSEPSLQGWNVFESCLLPGWKHHSGSVHQPMLHLQMHSEVSHPSMEWCSVSQNSVVNSNSKRGAVFFCEPWGPGVTKVIFFKDVIVLTVTSSKWKDLTLHSCLESKWFISTMKRT